jgi:hypothetical protein
MGANSATLKVRWRLPTLHDYELAEVDGIRSVMPDMGAFATNYEWSSSVNSSVRANAWVFYGTFGLVSRNNRLNHYVVRCVGR